MSWILIFLGWYVLGLLGWLISYYLDFKKTKTIKITLNNTPRTIRISI